MPCITWAPLRLHSDWVWPMGEPSQETDVQEERQHDVVERIRDSGIRKTRHESQTALPAV